MVVVGVVIEGAVVGVVVDEEMGVVRYQLRDWRVRDRRKNR